MEKHPTKGSKKTPFYTRDYVNEMIAEERQKEMAQMANVFSSMKIRATHLDSGFNIELDLTGEQATISNLKMALSQLKNDGFIPTKSGNLEKKDNTGKTGVVTSVTKIEGKEQWAVMVRLDEIGAGEQRIVSFSAKEYRKGDVVKLEKNVKGYLIGTIIEDSERPTKTDDIPF